MSAWIATPELLEALRALGTPMTRQGLMHRAKKEGWPMRQRRGRQGGYEFATPALPATLRAWLGVTEDAATAPAQPTAEELAAHQAAVMQDMARHWDMATATRRTRADKAAAAIRAVYLLVQEGAGKRAAIERVAREHRISARMLCHYDDRVRELPQAMWPMALLDRRGGNRDLVDIPPQAWELFKAFYLAKAQPPASICYERVQQAAEAGDWGPLPSLKTFMRRLRREVHPDAIILDRQGEHALTRAYPHQQRDKTGMHALEAINADGHKFDVFVRNHDGKIVRICLVCWQDVYSGKILGWRVDDTENKEAVRLSLADVIRNYGRALHVFFDNGRGFANKWLTGRAQFRFRFKIKDEDAAGILVRMGSQVHFTTPYWGQAKPIERAFRDMCDRIAKHPLFAGAYTGNKPDAKPEDYGSAAIPWKVFVKVVEREIAAHNARPGRRTDVCGGKLSFDQAFEQSYALPEVRARVELPDAKHEPHLKRMLLCAEAIKVSAEATVTIAGGNRYWHEALTAWRGKLVDVRFDPQSLQTGVEIESRQGEAICRATYLDKAGFTDTAAGREHVRARNRYKRAARQMLNAEKTIKTIEAAQMLPDVREIERELAAEAAAENIIRPKFATRDDDAFDAEEALAAAVAGWTPET